MAVVFGLRVGGCTWQSAESDLATQGINDPQDICQAQGGLARFKIDDEAHAYPCRQRQLRLCQPKLLAGGTKYAPKLLR